MSNHKIEFKNQNKIKGEIILSTVADDASGIHIRLRGEDKNIYVCFTPKDVWGKIPDDKDPKKELQKIADLLNGYKELPNGDIIKIPGFVPKIVTLIK